MIFAVHAYLEVEPRERANVIPEAAAILGGLKGKPLGPLRVFRVKFQVQPEDVTWVSHYGYNHDAPPRCADQPARIARLFGVTLYASGPPTPDRRAGLEDEIHLSERARLTVCSVTEKKRRKPGTPLPAGRVKSWRHVVAMLGDKERRKIGNNTYLERRAEDEIAVRLHITDILIFTPRTVTLNTGGWKTVTTRARLGWLCPLPIGSKRNVWYVAPHNRNPYQGEGVPFAWEYLSEKFDDGKIGAWPHGERVTVTWRGAPVDPWHLRRSAYLLVRGKKGTQRLRRLAGPLLHLRKRIHSRVEREMQRQLERREKVRRAQERAAEREQRRLERIGSRVVARPHPVPPEHPNGFCRACGAELRDYFLAGKFGVCPRDCPREPVVQRTGPGAPEA